MAEYGFQVFAQDGSGAAQIDGTYQNYFLRAKQTVVLNEKRLFTTATSCGEAVINVNCNTTPIVVVAQAATSPGPCCDTLITPPAGGHGTPGVYSIFLAGPLNAQADIYIFDSISLSDSPNNYGLRVFNNAGKLVYDASLKPLRVVGILTASRTSMPTGISVPSGKKYGVLCNAGGYNTTTGGSPVTYLYFLYGGTITTTGFATVGVFQTGSSSSVTTSVDQATTAFVVDLTGY